MRLKGFKSASTLSVGTSPTELKLNASAILYNDGPGKVFLGPPDVSPSTGIPIEVGSGLALELTSGTRIWLVSDSSATVRVIEILEVS